MNESTPARWNDVRDAAFFGITAEQSVGFVDDTTLLIGVLAGNDPTGYIQEVLDDVIAVAEF
jgi:hypothetical protein